MVCAKCAIQDTRFVDWTATHSAKKALPPTKFGLSASKADADLEGYFHDQKVLAAKPRVALKPVNKSVALLLRIECSRLLPDI